MVMTMRNPDQKQFDMLGLVLLTTRHRHHQVQKLAQKADFKSAVHDHL
jgi:hypothetical protein